MKRRSKLTVLIATSVVLVLSLYLGRSLRTKPQHEVQTSSAEMSSAVHWAQRKGAASPATISGQISSTNGAPLAQARVCASCADCYTLTKPPDPFCVASDQDGRYSLSGLSEGDYRLSASAAGHQLALIQAGRPLLLRKRDIPDQDAVLAPGGAQLAGVVLDATGGPVVAAKVRARLVHGSLPEGRDLEQITETDEAGAFVLYLPEGKVDVLATADGYAPAISRSYAPARDVQLLLTPQSRIVGTVFSHVDGEPVSGVRITALGERGGDLATSDDDGAFQIVGLPPGTYTLEASGEGWLGRYSGTVTVDLGETLRDVKIPVERGVAVTARVSLGSKPCVTGTVHLGPAAGESLPELQAKTDLDGRARFEAVPGGRYETAAICEGYGLKQGAPLEVALEPVDGLAFHFDAFQELVVHLRSASGRPLPNSWASLRSASATNRQNVPAPEPRTMEANEHGDIHFRGVEPGSYVIATPHDAALAVPVRVVEGSALQEVTVRLPGKGSLEVWVKDEQGRPNDQLAVSAISTADDPGGFAKARGDGRYLISLLSEGEHQIEVRDASNPALRGEGALAKVAIRAGELTKLDVTYGGFKGAISGQVVDENGAPAENVWVSVRPDGSEKDGYDVAVTFQIDAASKRRLTDAEGKFEIEGLKESGVFTVVATHTLGGEARLSGVRVGTPARLTLSTPGSLSGLVLDAAGRPARNFRLLVRNEQAHQDIAPMFGADANGRWSVENVSPGNLKIVAYTPDGSATATCELAPAQKKSELVLQLHAPHAIPMAKADGTKETVMPSLGP